MDKSAVNSTRLTMQRNPAELRMRDTGLLRCEAAMAEQLQNDVIEELRERIAQHEQAMRQCLIDMEIDDPNLIDFTLDELVAHYAVKGWDTLRLSLQTCKRRGERIRELEAALDTTLAALGDV
jgi:hypothetical protein